MARLALAALLWVWLAAPSAAQAQAVGTIRVFGPWIVDGRRVDNDTLPVYDGALIRLADGVSAAQRRAARLIVYYSVPGTDPQQCFGGDRCAEGFRVKARGTANPLIAKLLAYLRPAPEPDVAAARGAPQILADAVLQRTGDRVDLAPLLANVESGRYRVVLTAQRAPAARVVANVLVDVSPGAASSVAVGDAGDGLYALQFFDPATLEPQSNVAWLAVAADSGYDARRTAFAQAQDFARSWSPTPENRAAAASLLHGLVLALADPAWHP